MNLKYVKEYLLACKDTIKPEDIDNLITEIDSYLETKDSFLDIAGVMRTMNEKNMWLLTCIEAYEVLPKNDMNYIPQRMEKVREILSIISSLHTFSVLAMSSINESTYDTKSIRTYIRILEERKELFKSERMSWVVVLKSLTQEMEFASDMRRMDIEDQLGFVKWGNKQCEDK